MKLSVVLATYNEENNIGDCLMSVMDIADDIVIVDGSSSDKTVEIAKSFGARVIVTQNHPIFHINKQKALEQAKNTWVLQLDADERVSKELAEEIKSVIKMTDDEIESYQNSLPNHALFLRHQSLLEKRDGSIGKNTGEYAAFFIPRLNYFMGRYLRFGGVYPDGVIRLVKKDKAYFPCKSVHEQISVNGKVGWLQNPLYHWDSPNFARYLQRNNRYIDLLAKEISQKNILSLINYSFYKPLYWFILTYIRHKGFKDSWQGFLFSLFSALRFPRAYYRSQKKK